MDLCIDCGADLNGRTACPSCDLPNVAEVHALHARMAAAEQRFAILKTVFAVGVLIAFGIGAGLSSMMTTPRATVVAEGAEMRQAMDKPLAIPVVNDLFVRTLDERVRLGLRGWVQHPNGTVILEMAPPTKEQPRTLWEHFTAPQKKEVAELIAAGYTSTLFQTRNPVNVERDGHPPIALRYYGTDAPVMLRTRDGTIHLYPSPYAGDR